MGDLTCPKCKQKHLRVHSILVPSKQDGFQDVHYEWECCWCGYSEGDYETPAAAREAYAKKYGGINQ